MVSFAVNTIHHKSSRIWLPLAGTGDLHVGASHCEMLERE